MIKKLIVYGLVHNRTEKIELKTHPMFSVHTKPEKLENARVTSHFRFLYQETSGNEMITLTSSFPKALFLNSFPSTLKRKPRFSNFSGLKVVYGKLSCSWRISVDGWPNRRNKAAYSNFSLVVCTELESWKLNGLIEYCLNGRDPLWTLMILQKALRHDRNCLINSFFIPLFICLQLGCDNTAINMFPATGHEVIFHF